MHINPNPLHLLLQPPTRKRDHRDERSPNTSTQGRDSDEAPPAVPEGGEEPDEQQTTGDSHAEEIDVVDDGCEGGGLGWGEGVQVDVGAVDSGDGGVEV